MLRYDSKKKFTINLILYNLYRIFITVRYITKQLYFSLERSRESNSFYRGQP